jgi:hypothetical protein
MDKTLQETKESLDKIQETTSINLKQALGSFEEERKMLTKKIEVSEPGGKPEGLADLPSETRARAYYCKQGQKDRRA